MKRLLVVLFAFLSSSFVVAQSIEKTYYFDEPQFVSTELGDHLLIDGCLLSARAGQPVLPWKNISLLLPPGEEAVAIEVIYGDFVQLETKHLLAPYQPSRPLSEDKPSVFVKDEKLYNSNHIYPLKAHGELLTSWFNGMGFAISTITPVHYIPAEQQVYYAKEVTVKIKTAPVRSDQFVQFQKTPTQLSTASKLAQNVDMMALYKQQSIESRELSETDLLIITKASYVTQFVEYQAFLLERGFTSELETIEAIAASGSGIDLQEKIRNFVIEKYNEKGIHSLLLGGDVDIVPARGLYCYVESGSGYSSNDIPADLYYAALDGTWNDDGDDRWGEPGEDDLLPEIGVARMPFGNVAELDNMLNKILMYQDQPVLGELENPLFAGENLYSNPDTWGRDYLELLVGETDENGYTTIGIPESYEIEKMYEFDNYWSGSDLINSINQGKQFVHHVGHASQTYVAHLDNSDITAANFAATNGIDHNFTLMHTHGCDCGAFDYNDCILEKMVLIENFAVAVIGNSRYGWFNEGQTEGPSAHLHREMTDAFYHDRIPYLGLALRESKVETAPWVTAPGQWEEGALRWNFYDLNILGDPMLSVWTSEPFEPEVDYTSELIIGLTETTVYVSRAGEPLAGYRCHLRQNGEIIGVGETDADGNAVIVFDQALNETGEASLVVVGQNILPVDLPVTIIPNEGPYLIWESMEVVDEQGNANGEADYGETISLNIGIKNIGSEDIENVMAQISVEDDWIVTVLESELEIGTITAGETVILEDVFLLEISTFVPPDYAIGIEMVLTSGDESWTDHFDLEILIPGNHISHYEIDDEAGNQNGMLDAGETVQFHVFGGNKGTSAAHDISISLSEYASEWLTIENGNQYIGSL
ncbi:MAG TPA: C25 family cysteine peptidase, partial [Bacteroidales bacterium]|nr:C25 family cysteine peptidase [Bacteroidales bacterium]